MATTKAPAKTAANTKSTPTKTTAIVPWEQEMAEAAKKGAEKERLSGGFKSISTQGGILKVDDTPVPGNEMLVVAVASVFENQLYLTPYDANNPSPPACFAFGDPNLEDPEDSMAPHEKAEQPQGDDNGLCANCECNKMGSADVGRGKACKNIRRVAVITPDALESPEALKAAEMRKVNVPVMSVKHWAKYVHSLSEDMSRTPFGVVSRLKLVPDPKAQFLVMFEFEELINFDGPLYAAMKAKVKEAQDLLLQPYPTSEEMAANAAAAKAQPARKVIPIKNGGKAAPVNARAAVPLKTPAKTVPVKAAAGAKKAKY